MQNSNKMSIRDTRVGWLLALTATVLYSTNTVVARGVIVAGMDSTTLVFGRFAGGALLFTGTLALTGVGRAHGSDKPFDRGTLLICLLSGGTNGLTLLAYYRALTYLTASLASVIGIALFPSMTLLFLALRGERITRRKLVRLGLVAVGLYWLVEVSGTPNVTGLIFLFIAAATYAIHLASVQWFLKPYNTWATTGTMMIAAAVVVTIFWLFSGRPAFVPGFGGWAAIVYQGVFLIFIGRLVLYAAIDRIGSAQVALLAPIETVLAIVWSFLFLAERLNPAQIVGALFILTSAALAGEKAPPPTVEPAVATIDSSADDTPA